MSVYRSRVTSKEQFYILNKSSVLFDRLTEISKSLEKQNNPNPFLKESIEKIADSIGNISDQKRVRFFGMGNIQEDLKTINKIKYDVNEYPESYRIPQYRDIFNKE